MKKLMIIAAACVALVACNKSEFTDGQKIGTRFEKGQEVTLRISSADTKVNGNLDVSTGNVDFTWENGDNIKVTVGSTSAEFTLSKGAGSKDGEFTGTMPESGEEFTVEFPSTGAPDITSQTYVANALPHNMMYAKAENCTIDTPFCLVPQNAALRLNLYGDNAIGKIVVTNTSSTETPKPTYTLSCGSGVVIGEEKNDSTAFIIIVPAGTYKFSAEIFNNAATPASICTFETTQSQITAGKILNMPAKIVPPKGALSGSFSVSATKKVRFSMGNLQATYHQSTSSYTWGFAANQYDFIGSKAGNTTIGNQTDGAVVDFFGWSTANTNYGINTSTNSSTYSGEFKDWGTTIDNEGTWYTLSMSEWNFLIGNTSPRKSSLHKVPVTVCGVSNCLVIAPDNWDIAANPLQSTYDASAWAQVEQQGLLCLPRSGYRYGSTVEVSYAGHYWSSTKYGNNSASNLGFSSNVYQDDASRQSGFFVRLVTDFK